MFNKVTIKGAKQAVQMFGPAQHAVAKAVADQRRRRHDPAAEADDVFICVGVFIHWDAADDKKIHDFNYRDVKESIERAVSGKPTPAEVVVPARFRQAPVQPLGRFIAERSRLHLWEPFISEARLPRTTRSENADRIGLLSARASIAMRIRSIALRAPSFCLSWVQLLAIVL